MNSTIHTSKSTEAVRKRFKEVGSLFSSFDELRKKTYKGFGSIDEMPNAIQDVFNRKFSIDSDKVSKFTMEQIKAKSAALGLTDSLTAQVVAMASDADFSAKAASKQLTWGKALDDNKISAEDLTDALKKQGKLSEDSIKILDRFEDKTSSQYKNRLKGMIESVEGLSDEIIDLGDAGDIFSKKWGGIKDIGKGIIATLKPLAPYIGGAMAAMAAFTAFDYATHDYTRKLEVLKTQRLNMQKHNQN